MIKVLFAVILIQAVYIGATFPYAEESIRHHVAVRVSQWEETRQIYKQHNSVDVDIASFQKVDLPPIRGINQ